MQQGDILGNFFAHSSPITPNSAAAELVFSMLKAMFGDQQMETLADIIQTALMLRINKRRVGRAVLMEYSKAVKCAYE